MESRHPELVSGSMDRELAPALPLSMVAVGPWMLKHVQHDDSGMGGA